MTAQVPPFSELITQARASAVHLEMRDTYTPHDPEFLAWLDGKPASAVIATPGRAQWAALVGEHTARGVAFRRARIVSEPVTDYIRFEHAVTAGLNIAAGEQVRWLPRRRASDLCLPGNDFWVFDGRLVRFGHFAGDGEFLDHDLTDDPAVAGLCAAAFEAVWQRATDHAGYQPA